MILLTRGQQARAYVTASEKAVLNPTVFNISFTHDLTKQEVVFLNVVDESPAPERYNLFMLDISSFDEADNGFYQYKITDQDGNILEIGKAKLVGDRPEVKQYDGYNNSYQTYGE